VILIDCARAKKNKVENLMTNAGGCQQTFKNTKFVEVNQQCFALSHQGNFPANILNFH
jgi:hypothetical protein